MNGYDSSMGANSNPAARAFGAALGCGALGMTSYYMPINKNTFVEEAFDVLKKETQSKIDVLTLSGDEIANNKLTNKNKIFLNEMGVMETLDAVKDKCKELREGITDSFKVKELKGDFDRNFEMYKKSASSRDNTVSQAMKNIKLSRLGWGAAIGAVVGIAFSLMKNN